MKITERVTEKTRYNENRFQKVKLHIKSYPNT